MARPQHFDFVFKLVLIGDSSTGKTAASRRYVDDVFARTVASTGVDFKYKVVQYKNRIVKVQIWDTAGQERYRSITSHFFRGAAGVMVFYDITSRVSFSNLSYWFDFIKSSCFPDNAPLMLVGCKSDLSNKRCVQFHEGELMAKKYQIPFFEVSNRTGENIEECFSVMVKDMLSSTIDGRNHTASIVSDTPSPTSVTLDNKTSKPAQKSCCSGNISS